METMRWISPGIEKLPQKWAPKSSFNVIITLLKTGPRCEWKLRALVDSSQMSFLHRWFSSIP